MSENTEVVVGPKAELLEVINDSGVSHDTALAVQGGLSSFLEQATGWQAKVSALLVTKVTQTAEMKDARESRLALRKIRTDMEKKHKSLKEDSLKRGRALDGAKNYIIGVIKPMEEHLLNQEEFLDRKIEKEKDEEEAKRKAQIALDTDMDPDMMLVRDISEDEFQRILLSGIDAKEGRLARETREAEEEAKRQAEEEAEKKRQVEENVRLKAEAEERNYKLQLGRDRNRMLQEFDAFGDIEGLGDMTPDEWEASLNESRRQFEVLEEERKKREAAEEAARAKEKKEQEESRRRLEVTRFRMDALADVDCRVSLAEVEGLTDDAYESLLAKATDNYEAKAEAQLEEAQEKERVEAEAVAKREKESADLRNKLDALKAAVGSGADHAVEVLVDTAEIWADRNKIEGGRNMFIRSAIAKLQEHVS